jgi:Major intrinsic protein
VGAPGSSTFGEGAAVRQGQDRGLRPGCSWARPERLGRGAHINPAVTVAMLAAGRVSARDAAGYIIAQLIGGIIGAGILLLIAPDTGPIV